MAEQNNMSVFTTSIVNKPDLVKQYLFQVNFLYEKGSALSDILDTEELLLCAKTMTIPQKEFNTIETHYMGSKLVYPGKATVAGEFTVQFDEFQDLSVSIALHRWANLLFSQGFENDIDVAGRVTGGASSNYAKDYTATVEILLYDSTLKKLLPVKWVLYRVFPKTIATSDLGAEQEGKVTRNCTFSYSNFEMVTT